MIITQGYPYWWSGKAFDSFTAAMDKYFGEKTAAEIFEASFDHPEKLYNAVEMLPGWHNVVNESGEAVSIARNVAVQEGLSGGSTTINAAQTAAVTTGTETATATVTQATTTATATAASQGLVLGTVVPAACAVGVGAALGAMVGNDLYDQDPGFWTGLETELEPQLLKIENTLTPENYKKGLAVMIGADGKTYAREHDIDTIKNYLVNLNAFAESKTTGENGVETIEGTTYKSGTFYKGPADITLNAYRTDNPGFKFRCVLPENTYVAFIKSSGASKAVFFSDTAGKSVDTYWIYDPTYTNTYHFDLYPKETYNGKTAYSTADFVIGNFTDGAYVINQFGSTANTWSDPSTFSYVDWFTTWAALYDNATISKKGGVSGITVPDNVTKPNSTDGVKTTYKNWYDNGFDTTAIQPDGTTKTTHWMPVSMPAAGTSDGTYTAPADQTQTGAQTGSNTLPAQQTQVLNGADGGYPVTNTYPTEPPTANTGTTPAGGGLIGGNASGLITVYNPTLANLNDFAAWLWSANFIDQILKLFNDPMQAIIGLHIMYATPVINGTKNIKVGYLDSGVSANAVSDQYSYVDCGTVSLAEYFGDVTDYSGYTDIAVYLPFVGIVPLNVDDVMRSQLHIFYKVDVLTGTCLASIEVIRDNATITMYQYNGNAAVQLPVSSGSYIGAVTSLLGAGAGIASAVMTGGATTPMAVAGAGASALNARTRVSMSGNLGSNAGAMGPRKPYLIISRTMQLPAASYNTYYGYPANSTVVLSSVSGYTKVKDLISTVTQATDAEKAEITSMLQGGVFL